ncbi:hypothetical protein EMCRGX_G020767 [Ephydatia muelleri]
MKACGFFRVGVYCVECSGPGCIYLIYDLKDFNLLLPPGLTLSTIGHFAKAIVGADGKVINLCDHVVYTVEKRYSLETGTFCGSFQAEMYMEPIVDAQQKPVFNSFD